MKRRQRFVRAFARACAPLVPAAILLAGPAGCRRPAEPPAVAEVARGPLSVWTACEGVLEARRMQAVSSRFPGSATIVELAPEGAAVAEGDRVVRFDPSDARDEVVRCENEEARAAAELDALANAEIPLEKQDIEVQIGEARYQAGSERQYLQDSAELVAKNLVSTQELAQQELKVASLDAKLSQLEHRRKLVDEHLHPARLAKARSALTMTREQLDAVRQRLASCEVTAPAAGLVVYHPVHVGGEFRTVRVGDSVFQNQVFMSIPDPSDLLARCHVPESDWSGVAAGNAAAVAPLACPDRRLSGAVETVDAVAQAQPGHPAWQKSVGVLIRLDEQDPRIRPGMSVTAEILSFHSDDVVLIPRVAVRWENGQPQGRVRTDRGEELRPLTLGRGNDAHFQVLGGAAPGERVLLP